MSKHERTKPGGFQIAFLIFAVVFLASPFHKYLGPLLGIGEPPGRVAGRLFIFVPAIAILVLVPGIRRFCRDQLTTPIRRERRVECGLVTLAQLALPFAIAGATVLWYWFKGGEMSLARRIGQQRPLGTELAQALTLEGILFSILLAAVIAPLVEELVFRGLLYRAWEARWGWFWSMIATSAVFAAYHPVPFAAFISSIVFVAVLRRTGSLWAPIIVHAAGNLFLWPPLLGQFYFRTAGKETGEIALWTFHIVAFALLVASLPIYVWLARERRPGLSQIGEEATPARC